MLISLGHACQVKHHIDNYTGYKQPTHFFDWLITDFRTVLHVFRNINNPSNFLLFEKFTDKHVFLNRDSWDDKCHKVEHVDCKMISIHNFPKEHEYYTCIYDYINVCTRRLNRLKECIMNDTIHFIHTLDHQFTELYIPTRNDISELYDIIKNINKNAIFFIHIVIPPKYKDLLLDDLIISPNIFVYTLKKNNNNDLETWENKNFNWEIVFNNINNLLN